MKKFFIIIVSIISITIFLTSCGEKSKNTEATNTTETSYETVLLESFVSNEDCIEFVSDNDIEIVDISHSKTTYYVLYRKIPEKLAQLRENGCIDFGFAEKTQFTKSQADSIEYGFKISRSMSSFNSNKEDIISGIITNHDFKPEEILDQIEEIVSEYPSSEKANLIARICHQQYSSADDALMTILGIIIADI